MWSTKLLLILTRLIACGFCWPTNVWDVSQSRSSLLWVSINRKRREKKFVLRKMNFLHLWIRTERGESQHIKQLSIYLCGSSRWSRHAGLEFQAGASGGHKELSQVTRTRHACKKKGEESPGNVPPSSFPFTRAYFGCNVLSS